MRGVLLAGLLLLWGGAAWAAGPEFDHDHTRWNQLLSRHVWMLEEGRQSQVDYAGLLEEHDSLRLYLEELAAVDRPRFDGWSEQQRLAFLINAYNAWTVELILGEYPDLDSIRDLGSLFRSPWSRRIVNLFGESLSLDYVEHRLIRGAQGFGEPRIHFAVNCASIGCPALRPEAFVGERLEEQLENATRLFLADPSRNRLQGDTLWVSELFDWYAEDFRQGWRGIRSVSQFLARYRDAMQLPAGVSRDLAQDRVRIRYLDYDWRLNDLTP
ncbi:MAG: DUF547 domain-containing protein [Pseudomonadales bacterium]|nr:DUF547 domain-containing protein [Pseudomonadales bacterium]MCP5345474.1 DUF547 domain-containing protein [Pseudomonadales bacterium]